MSILVIAEHDNNELKVATLNTVAAASEIGGDIEILIAGNECEDVANQAAQIPGVQKILLADKPAYVCLLTNCSCCGCDVMYHHSILPSKHFHANTLQ